MEYLRPKVDSQGNVYGYEYDIFGQAGDFLKSRLGEMFSPAPTSRGSLINKDGSIGVDKPQPYKSRREGLETVYPERATPSYQSRREGLENVYPERYESNVEETKPTPTPTPETASTFSSPFNVEINFEDFRNPSTAYLPGYKESDFRPGYRENPLTAGSMKGDHKFINPRQKAIMASKELTERRRERKAVEAFSDSIGTKGSFKPDEFAKGTEIFEKGFLNNADNFDYHGLFDPSTRTGI
jgi:hypothetical protein